MPCFGASSLILFETWQRGWRFATPDNSKGVRFVDILDNGVNVRSIQFTSLFYQVEIMRVGRFLLPCFCFDEIVKTEFNP